jgi:hypothetical protein
MKLFSLFSFIGEKVGKLFPIVVVVNVEGGPKSFCTMWVSILIWNGSPFGNVDVFMLLAYCWVLSAKGIVVLRLKHGSAPKFIWPVFPEWFPLYKALLIKRFWIFSLFYFSLLFSSSSLNLEFLCSLLIYFYLLS